MIKILAAVFADEATAQKGLKALNELNATGDISLFESVVLAKDASGKVTAHQPEINDLVGTSTGVVSGSLIGLLAGPVGMMIGATIGSLAGLIYDAYSAGISQQFLDEFTKALQPGKVAVVTQLDESWTAPVDTRIFELGGTVIRRYRADSIEDEISRQGAAFSSEYKALKREMKTATGEKKAGIEKYTESIKSELKDIQSRAKNELDKAKAQADARLKALEAQAKELTGDAKARVEERITSMKADYKVRSEKLDQAWKLAKEALEV